MNSVTIGTHNLYDDFNLVLSSRNIPLPEPKEHKVEVPCSDGELDLSTTLTNGVVKYKNIPITLFFTSMDGADKIDVLRSELGRLYQGKFHQVLFDTEPEYYYYGKVKITKINTEEYPYTVTIEVDADPYKYDVDETIKTVTATSTGANLVIEAQSMPIVPVINVTNSIEMVVGTKRFQLSVGDNVIPDVFVTNSPVTLKFMGTGTVKVTYRKGRL